MGDIANGLNAEQPVMRAVTSRGRVVNMTRAQAQQLARPTVAERVLLDTERARSTHATLVFRGLLVVALVVAALIALG